MPRRAAGLGLALCFLIAAPRVRADDSPGKERARQLLAQGNAQYAAGDFRGALAHFRQAYDFFPSPKLLVNTAACEKALGRLDHAASDLAQFLRLHDRDRAPSAEQRALADRARIDLDVLAGDLGRITVVTGVHDAIVEVDGEESSRVIYVTPGEHKVLLREPGLPSFETRVRVDAGGGVEVRRAAAPVERVEQRPVVVAPVSGPAPVIVADPPRKRASWVLPVAIGGAAFVVVLGLGLGLGLGLHRDAAPLTGIATVTFDPGK